MPTYSWPVLLPPPEPPPPPPSPVVIEPKAVRLAIPKITRDRDPDLMRWLKVWDMVFDQVADATTNKVRDRGLFDVDRIPLEALPVAFESAGLVYPDFDEISIAHRRRILRNADEIHQTRYSFAGLQFYLSLLVDVEVTITGINAGFFIFFNSEPFGFPTPAMMNTSQTDNDICTYFVGLRSGEIVITILGVLSLEMRAFLEETIFRELPMFEDAESRLVRVDFPFQLDSTEPTLLTYGTGPSDGFDGPIVFTFNHDINPTTVILGSSVLVTHPAPLAGWTFSVAVSGRTISVHKTNAIADEFYPAAAATLTIDFTLAIKDVSGSDLAPATVVFTWA